MGLMKRLLEHKLDGIPINYNPKENEMAFQHEILKDKHIFSKGRIKIEVSYDTTMATDNNGTESGEEVKGLHVFVLYKTDEDKWQPICRDIWNESVIEQQMKMNDLLAEVELQNDINVTTELGGNISERNSL